MATTSTRGTGQVLPLRPHKNTGTRLDTVLVTLKVIGNWLPPPFQRPLKVNTKVEELGRTIARDGGVIPGTITLGVVEGKTYILDGQHRIKAFELSGIQEGYCDVRIHYLDSMADAGEEFVHLNSSLVRFSADDILRGLEGSSPSLQYLRKNCPFVGYGNIRRSETNAVVSASLVVRSWSASTDETPGLNSSAGNIIRQNGFDEASAKEAALFLILAHEAWGKDPIAHRLWGSVNLSICMWLYRRLVRGYARTASSRVTPFTPERFRQCLMGLSADRIYVDWLVGRHSPTRDRSAAYGHMKRIFQRRFFEEARQRPTLPAPEWAAK